MLESGFFFFPAGYLYTVLDEESDSLAKIAQFRRLEVESRESRFLLLGFLKVHLHCREVFVLFFVFGEAWGAVWGGFESCLEEFWEGF